ncbi:Protein of unknown function [Nonomuraea maritima]|uniref:DUF2510 domain-containing protein n=1 Tax=Nonomuraea maritima TaxID=683260 RepID=A0A1G9CIB9_9ACTN|nr:DUF2510 domain-containing protein [Nonomuraea maritima]SDK51392.1 Protein of unknown function [Nonomuraea maritima]
MDTAQLPLPPDLPEPGFYRDPGGGDRLRYWDGSGWTSRTAPLPRDGRPPSPQAGHAAPGVPGAPAAPGAPRKGMSRAAKWLVAVTALAALAGLGWGAAVAVAVITDENPVLLVMPTGQEVRREDMGDVLDQLATYADAPTGKARSSERWEFCSALPDAFLEKGVRVEYPAGEGAFTGECVRAS